MDFLKRLLRLGGTVGPEAEPDMIGWVVLANTDVELTVDSVRATLDALYPGNCGDSLHCHRNSSTCASASG